VDWNRFIVLAAQCVIVIVLGTLVGLGHDSVIADGLLIVSGSVTGVNIYATVKTPLTKV
jgi:hypothetical protein